MGCNRFHRRLSYRPYRFIGDKDLHALFLRQRLEDGGDLGTNKRKITPVLIALSLADAENGRKTVRERVLRLFENHSVRFSARSSFRVSDNDMGNAETGEYLSAHFPDFRSAGGFSN